MIGPKEKRERALGVQLQLKATRGGTPKSAMVRKPYPPGQHGNSRKRPKALSDFGRQLREKQKCKVSYGIDERNLRQIFARALKLQGSTSLRLLQLLEGRLDNVVYRLGFGGSRAMARQFVTQGHITVNKKRVRAPGYQVKVGDVVAIREESAGKTAFKMVKERLEKYEPVSWLELEADKLTGKVVGLPEEASAPFEVNLLVESFSK
jgi:small subunit ribosomal protein S4